MDKEVDHGWAWIVLVSTFLSCVNVGCLTYNVGIINVGLLEKFEQNVATTAFVGVTFLSLFFLTGPIASIFINRRSCRVTHIIGGCLAFIGFSSGYFANNLEVLIFTYGIFGGLGLCLCNNVTYVILCFNFKKYFGFAIGLSMVGSGCGMFISGPFSQYLIDIYDLQGAYLIMGGIALNQVVLGSLMRPSYSEKFHKLKRVQINIAGKRNWRIRLVNFFQLDLLKNKSFIVIMICAFLWNVPYSIIIVHLPNFVVLQGFTAEKAALLTTIFGIGSTLNRLLTGLSLGPKGLDPLLLFLGFNGTLGVLTLTFNAYSLTYTGQVIFSFLFGIYTGGLNALRNPLCLNLVGLQNVSSAIGMIFFAEGLGFIVGPPTAGIIVDTTQSYKYSFFLSGIFFIATCMLSLTASIWRKQPEPEMASHEDIVCDVSVIS